MRVRVWTPSTFVTAKTFECVCVDHEGKSNGSAKCLDDWRPGREGELDPVCRARVESRCAEKGSVSKWDRAYHF